MTKDENIGFVDSVSREVADNYRRLYADKRFVPVFKKLKELKNLKKLKKRNLNDQDIEVLLRGIALLRLEWRTENEGWNTRKKRRTALAKKLRKLAIEAAADPDLKGLRISADAISINPPPDQEDDLQSFAEVLNLGASILEPSDDLSVMAEDGKLLTAEEADRLYSPARKVSEQSYVLLRIFGMLEPYFEAAPNSLPPRAPNKIVETLGSVLLQKKIKSGTVSKLRPDDRRKYTPDPPE